MPKLGLHNKLFQHGHRNVHMCSSHVAWHAVSSQGNLTQTCQAATFFLCETKLANCWIEQGCSQLLSFSVDLFFVSLVNWIVFFPYNVRKRGKMLDNFFLEAQDEIIRYLVLFTNQIFSHLRRWNQRILTSSVSWLVKQLLI